MDSAPPLIFSPTPPESDGERRQCRIAIAGALTAWLALGLGCGPDAFDAEPVAGERALESIQHVVLISIDTLRADYLGAYGHPYLRSPHIDELANRGIRFNNSVSAAPTTLASHTSIMTGLHPHSHGVGKNSFVVPDETVMLAEILRDEGFSTSAVLGAAALQSAVHFPQGFEFVDEDFERAEVRAGKQRGQRTAEQVTDAAIRWLDRSSPGRKFLFVHYFDTHWSYRPPEPYDRIYRADDSPIVGTIRDIKSVRQALRAQEEGAVERAEILEQLYSSEVTYADHHIGRLFDALRTHGIWDDALVILTSDHGETMWEHSDYFSHGLGVYDTTVRVPLIVRLPGELQAGRVVEEVVSAVDLAPTILEWLDIETPSRIEGVSFAAVSRGEPPGRTAPAFSEATHPFTEKSESDPRWVNMNKRQSARSERDKVVYYPLEDRFEHFDLRVDPLEQTPLAVQSVEARRLAAQLVAWRESADPVYTCRQENSETLKQLEALGYVEGEDSRACNRTLIDTE